MNERNPGNLDGRRAWLIGRREGLALDSVAGATATDLQEGVSGRVRSEAVSWSALRGMFR